MSRDIVMRVGKEIYRPELDQMDRFHMKRGDYAEWMLSDERTHFAGNQKVRVVNSRNIPELCLKAELPEDKVREAYAEALATGDILFVTYEEDSDG